MKKVLSIILALMIVAGFGSTVFAAQPNNPALPRVVDYADVLTAQEEEYLEQLALGFAENYDVDFVIYIDSSSHGKSDEAGAEDFYDENGYGVGNDFSGSICYICLEPGNSFVYTSACGKSINYFDYNNINIIDDATVGYYANGDFYQGLVVYADHVNELYKSGSLYEETDSSILDMLPSAGIVSVILGLGVGFISRSKALRSMHTVANANKAEAYKVPGSFNLSRSENIFLTMTVTRVPKADANHNQPHANGMHSGGSSFSGPHMSSGGHMHSGGGRHF